MRCDLTEGARLTATVPRLTALIEPERPTDSAADRPPPELLARPHRMVFEQPLVLASGSSLSGYELVYETYGGSMRSARMPCSSVTH